MSVFDQDSLLISASLISSMTDQTLKQLMDEVKSLRSEVREIRIAVNEIDEFQHRQIKPVYAKKLKKIMRQKGKTFASVEEFRKSL